MTWKRNVAYFFLLYVVIAGIYGALIAATNIIFVQTIPASLTILGFMFLKRGKAQRRFARIEVRSSCDLSIGYPFDLDEGSWNYQTSTPSGEIK